MGGSFSADILIACHVLSLLSSSYQLSGPCLESSFSSFTRSLFLESSLCQWGYYIIFPLCIIDALLLRRSALTLCSAQTSMVHILVCPEPVPFSHSMPTKFPETLTGLSTIRAYRQQVDIRMSYSFQLLTTS